MNEDWAAPTRAANDSLRAQIDSMLDTFNTEKSALLDAQAQAAALVSVWSDDGLVRVSGTIAGVSEVHVVADAFKKTTPESLGSSVTEAIAELARQTSQIQERAVGPLTASMPELSDLIPGVPSMKDLIAQLTPLPPPLPEPVVETPERLVDDSDDDEGEYFRNRSYLR